MTQDGFRQQPGFRPGAGQLPPRWGPPHPSTRSTAPQQGPWAAPRQRRGRGPGPLLLLAVLVLVGLFVYSTTLDEPATDTVRSGYENEDWAVPGTNDPVPDVPMPQYESDIAVWLQDNPLYRQQLPSPVRCDVAAIDNPGAMSDGALQTRMRGFVECLTRAWGPSLEAAGFQAYQPTLYVYPSGGEVSTSCGRQESFNAFYCGADQNLYLAADVLRILPARQAAARESYDLIIAHEYGHAMQGRSGLFAAFQYKIQAATSASVAKQASRRAELQADCFAGAAINSVADDMGWGSDAREAVAEISYEIGDDRLAQRFNQDVVEGDHGSAESRRAWAERGLSGAALSSCNTFVAPASEVE